VKPPHPRYEVVIGLEVHVHLRTASKLFSPAPVTYGELPNHSVHPIDLGLPGVLPVLNREAVPLAMRAAFATHCKVHARSVFARKNYFYPDLPKGYQISQLEEPLATGGHLDIVVGEGEEQRTRRIGITRIHMEEDAGKSIHDDAVAGQEGSHVDLNRCGVPLIEIVSEPDLRSPDEASAYLRAIRELLRWVEVSDADMEKGQLRCDVNVSLRKPGEAALGVRTECKNLNSFRFVEASLRAEITRQARLLDRGEAVVQATLHFDSEAGRLRVMRTKEDADDYRYFPDPDLIPLVIPDDELEAVRRALPELPDARRQRFQEELGLSESEARVLTSSRPLADFFEAAVQAHGSATKLAPWVLRDVLQAWKERELDVADSALTPEALASLVRLVESSTITARSARQLVPELVAKGGDPEALVRERGLEVVSDEAELEKAVVAALSENEKAVARFREGDTKVLNFLMGKVMQRTGGKADPGRVRALLARRLEE
jgi:aspartyl-tRNA(Asn)/glutamyl-tRNA(Gln) amidotransferase subunit B